jgi:hypothetical protein
MALVRLRRRAPAREFGGWGVSVGWFSDFMEDGRFDSIFMIRSLVCDVFNVSAEFGPYIFMAISGRNFPCLEKII